MLWSIGINFWWIKQNDKNIPRNNCYRSKLIMHAMQIKQILLSDFPTSIFRLWQFVTSTLVIKDSLRAVPPWFRMHFLSYFIINSKKEHLSGPESTLTRNPLPTKMSVVNFRQPCKSLVLTSCCVKNFFSNFFSFGFFI